MDIKGYEFVESLGVVEEGNDEFGFGEYKNKTNGKHHEILWVRNSPSTRFTVKRIFRKIRSCADFHVDGVQKILEVNNGSDNNPPHIVYEKVGHSGSDWTRGDFAQCISILAKLQGVKRYGFILNEDTVIKGNDGKMALRFIDLYELFETRVIRWANNDHPESRLKTADDIRSLASVFEGCFDSGSKFIFDKCRNREYKRYSELRRDLAVVKNPDYDDIRVTRDNKKIGDIGKLINKLNKGCYWRIQKQLPENNDIVVQWSTHTVSGQAHVKETLKIDGKRYGVFSIVRMQMEPNDTVLDKGTEAKFNFEEANSYCEYCCIDFFYSELEKTNRLAKIKEKVGDKWAALPKAMEKYVKARAFHSRYTKREPSKRNSEDIVFTLSGEFEGWDAVDEKKSSGVDLSAVVDDLGTKMRVGKILAYEIGENRLIVKDYAGNLKDIPEQGELIEDVTKLTFQYRKQIEACESFKQRDIANPDLMELLGTPKAPAPARINDSLFKPMDPKLLKDNSQKKTVLEALHTKPVYLIQGPPGTGKTTVIVEIIRQLIDRNEDARILLTSQSNMAVDNVLKKLDALHKKGELQEDISFMRLPSKSARMGTLKEVKKHIFKTKLKEWIKETSEESKKYFSKKYFNGIGDEREKMWDLYMEYQRKNLSIPEFQKEYRQPERGFRGHAEKLFGTAESKQDVETIFRNELGEEYIALKGIQDRWLAYVKNAVSAKRGWYISLLSNGCPLQASYVQSMNVLGVTCMHIANPRYSKMHFKFDYMIMDEASKATAAEALVPINMAKNIILIGDHKQLPPMVMREKSSKQRVEDEGLDIDETFDKDKSLFEELFEGLEKDGAEKSPTTMLSTQYRMPRQLGHLISKYIYGGTLRNPDLELNPTYDSDKCHNINFKLKLVEIGEKKPAPSSIVVVSTSADEERFDNDTPSQMCNEHNVKVIQETLECLQRQHVNNRKHLPRQVGIIAAYRGQVELLREKVGAKAYDPLQVNVNTVDKFQGSEEDIIIYDLVRSNEEGSIGFLDDHRRINVAFSRAKKLLIVVGDSDFFINRAEANRGPSKTKDLVIKKIMLQFDAWGCIYNSLDEAIENG